MTGMTPGKLAKELGVRPLEMFTAMQELRLHAKRMDALLTAPQEETLRRHYANKAAQRERGIRKSAQVTRTLAAQSPPTPAAPAPVPRTCPCCDRRWLAKGDDLLATCPPCRDHIMVANEQPDRRIARLESHLGLLRVDRDQAYEHAQGSNAGKQASYESRAKWRAALAEVVLDHEEGPDGLCWCGHAMPCRTWRKLDDANKGIHRQIEKWSSWSEQRLDEFLYGESRTSNYVIDEDEPADDRPSAGDGVAS